MGASLLVATLGLGIRLVAVSRRTNTLPARAMARLPGLHKLIYNKYYVDEIYQATAVRAFMAAAPFRPGSTKHVIDGIVNLSGLVTRLFARAGCLVDAYVVDGLVNLVGGHIRAMGQGIRRLQTGKLPSYLAGAR